MAEQLTFAGALKEAADPPPDAAAFAASGPKAAPPARPRTPTSSPPCPSYHRL